MTPLNRQMYMYLSLLFHLKPGFTFLDIQVLVSTPFELAAGAVFISLLVAEMGAKFSSAKTGLFPGGHTVLNRGCVHRRQAGGCEDW